MVTAKARIRGHEDYVSVVPILLPDLDEVRRFAAELHTHDKPWKGEAFGWPAEYDAEKPEPPLDSKMHFTPASFCIGETGVWFFSLMWEHGCNAPPVEFLDDKNILQA